MTTPATEEKKTLGQILVRILVVVLMVGVFFIVLAALIGFLFGGATTLLQAITVGAQSLAIEFSRALAAVRGLGNVLIGGVVGVFISALLLYFIFVYGKKAFVAIGKL